MTSFSLANTGADSALPRLFHLTVVFVAVLCTYILTMPRTITLEDGGLFQMVCHLGGISHPPGYPLFTLLCNGMVHSPGVMAGNLVSAIFGALAAVALFEVARLFKDDLAFAYIASLGWAWSATFWSQAIIIEVYTLAALLFALCWWMTLMFARTRDARYWFGLCFVYGLALSDHWPLMILSTLGLVATIWPAMMDVLSRCKSPAFVILSVAAFSLGLLPYVYLFIDSNPPIAVFGGIHSISEFVRYIARSAYNDSNPLAGVMDKVLYAGWLGRQTLSEFGWFGAPIVLVGVVASFRSLTRSLAIALVLVWLGSTYVLLMLLNFEYSPFFRAVFIPYPIIACASIALWFAFGISTFIGYLKRYSSHATLMVFPAAIVMILLSNYARMDRSGSSLVDDYMRTVLMSLPNDAILFVRGDNQTGPIGYLHYVAGVRPDVEVRDWDNLVFANRLGSPFSSDKTREEEIHRYVDSSTRPVFIMDDGLSPRINYGPYFGYVRGGQDGYRFLPRLESLVDMMVHVYRADLVTNAHEQYFLYERLIQLSKQYVDYALEHNGSKLPVDVESRLQELQSTFPGKLITLQRLVNLGADPEQKQVLLDLAEQASRQIPNFATRQSLAVFYELYGRANMFEPANLGAAEKYFEKSVAVYPLAENTSICPLERAYKREGKNAEAQRIESRYPSKHCKLH